MSLLGFPSLPPFGDEVHTLMVNVPDVGAVIPGPLKVKETESPGAIGVEVVNGIV